MWGIFLVDRIFPFCYNTCIETKKGFEMGTRSRIAVMHGPIAKSIYCHWDGYLEHNGAILLEHYDSSKANHLVALGDLSSLGTQIGEKHPFSPHFDEGSKAAYDAAKEAGYCTFYGRDRGETGVEWKVAHTFDELFEQVENGGGEWYYVMRDGAWYCGNTYESDARFYKKLVLLADALASEAVEESNTSEKSVLNAFQQTVDQ
jgi:hypothetical protein